MMVTFVNEIYLKRFWIKDRGGENYTYLMLMKLSMSLKAKYLLVTIEMIFWWGGDGKRDKACQVY